mmetsp:Transcript_19298/g.60294  ORF Transcript_19298/g.60294 Transcript_19298/m.60294 type:complete len:222 (+) Transcript_19298:78-743(+)
MKRSVSSQTGWCATSPPMPASEGSSAIACTPWLMSSCTRQPAPCSVCRSISAASDTNSSSCALFETSTGSRRPHIFAAKASGDRSSAHASSGSTLAAGSTTAETRLSHIAWICGSGRPTRMDVLIRMSNQTWFGAACPARALVRLPQPEREAAHLTRASCAAPRSARPPPYETPTMPIASASARHSAALFPTSSSTALASATSAGPATSMRPSELNQPRAW